MKCHSVNIISILHCQPTIARAIAILFNDRILNVPLMVAAVLTRQEPFFFEPSAQTCLTIYGKLWQPTEFLKTIEILTFSELANTDRQNLILDHKTLAKKRLEKSIEYGKRSNVAKIDINIRSRL